MKPIVIVAFSSLFLASCNNNKAPSLKATTETAQAQDEIQEKIQLNNNQKWLVNEEMKPYVLRGEQSVTSYLAGNRTNHVALAKELKEYNNQLIKNCTMNGKSHDELHKWLHPHLTAVDELENTTEPHQAKLKVTQIAQSYQKYHLYFN